VGEDAIGQREGGLQVSVDDLILSDGLDDGTVHVLLELHELSREGLVLLLTRKLSFSLLSGLLLLGGLDKQAVSHLRYVDARDVELGAGGDSVRLVDPPEGNTVDLIRTGDQEETGSELLEEDNSLSLVRASKDDQNSTRGDRLSKLSRSYLELVAVDRGGFSPSLELDALRVTGSLGNSLLGTGSLGRSNLCGRDFLVSGNHGYRFEKKDERRMRVVVFDWDDTLFCTSDVLRSNYRIDIPPSYLASLRAVLAMSLAVTSDQTFIVSSSSPGWIEGCVSQFLPDIADLIAMCKVRLIPLAHHALGIRLKEPTLVSIVSECYSSLAVKCPIDFLLVGDQPQDLHPADQIRALIPSCSVRTWQMTKCPSIDQLESSLLSLCNHLADDLLKLVSRTSASTGILGKFEVSSP